jgi:hypothetical protein
LGGAAYDEKRNVLVLYGGRPVELEKCNQETWEWDGGSWAKKDVPPPTACDHVKMVYDSAHDVSLLFSGLDPSENQVHETWSYDPNHEQALLYGGYTSAPTDEFWTWKDGAWQEIDFPGPGKLSHFGMAEDTGANALYIFGGATRGSTFSSLTDKTWVLTGGRWDELAPAHSPSKRGSPALGYDPIRKRMVLYGGFDGSQNQFGDTWEWDGQDWNCLVSCK